LKAAQVAGAAKHLNGRRKPLLRRTPLLLMAAFLVLLMIGITLDEPSRVLEQARSICLACIGIG